MFSFIPHVLLGSLSLLIWVLWLYGIYPFSTPEFMFDGYGIHFVVGVGYAALQVLLVQLLLPSLFYTSAFFTAQTLIAVTLLGAIELLQVFEPTRRVQLGDFAMQSLGVLLSIFILWLIQRRKMYTE